MKITIKSLHLQNFKGIAHMDMYFTDGTNIIRARNGSGKTSLMYAFWWALGMDVPEVIPTVDGKEIHNLETKVTAMISKGGYEYKLCRIQTEKWKTNRATGVEEKYSNECVYSIDDVEFTLKNYKDKLAMLFDFSYEKLEMLTNKDYFNTDKPQKWNWASRRKELSEITGTDELLKGLADKSDYSLIADDLRKGFSVTEIRNAKRKALKGVSDEKDRNVTLIEDKQNDIAKYGAMDFAALEAQKRGYEERIAELNLSLAKGTENDAAAQTAAKINALINERNNLAVADRNELARLKNDADSFGLKLSGINRKAEELKSQKVDVGALLKRIEEKKTVQWNGDTVCPTCGQPLPAESIETAKSRFFAAIGAEIATLQTQADSGKKLNETIDVELCSLSHQRAERNQRLAKPSVGCGNDRHLVFTCPVLTYNKM